MRTWLARSALLALFPAHAFAQTPPQAPAANPASPIALALRGFAATPGLIPVYRKEGKTFAMIPRALLERPLWVSSNIRKGLGSSWIYANAQGPSWIARFHLGPNNGLQLVASNFRAKAPDAGAATDPAFAKLAAASFAESIVGAWPIKAADADAVLVDASGMALSDLGAWGAKLEAATRIGYGLDIANSEISEVSNAPNETVFAIRNHFYAPKAPLAAKGASLADGRSALVETVLSFSTLPERPMRPRAADERVGLFATARLDLDPGARPLANLAYGSRWRLEKLAPGPAPSKVASPIRFDICPEMPSKYRKAVAEGIAYWTQAFDEIGLLGAIETRVLDAEDGILAGGRRATVCFVAGDDIETAIGPSKVDPRTGEILEARILIPEIFMSLARFDFDMERPAGLPSGDPAVSAAADWSAHALSWSPAAREEVAESQLRALVAHEVGHALGLRHNFKGSAAYPFERLSAPGYRGLLSASVMDYLPANVYAKRHPDAGSAVQSGIGPYDKWAIAYAYSVFDSEREERSGLAKILARAASEPELAYATDEDTNGDRSMDPLASKFDLSSEPLRFARSRFDLANSSLADMAARAKAGTLDPHEARYALGRLFGATARPVSTIHRYFGGASLARQQGSSPAPSLSPIDPKLQREAMAFLADSLLNRYLEIPPEVLARAVPQESSRGFGSPSFEFDNKIDELQAAILKPFFTPLLTDKIMDAHRLWIPGSKAGAPMDVLEVQSGVKKAVWRELYSGDPSDRVRRNLQRSYADFLIAALRNPANLSTDPRAIFRDIAIELRSLAGSQSRNAIRSPTERSHLRDIAHGLDAALSAKVAYEKTP